LLGVNSAVSRRARDVIRYLRVPSDVLGESLRDALSQTLAATK
jgi:hypothetical protein